MFKKYDPKWQEEYNISEEQWNEMCGEDIKNEYLNKPSCLFCEKDKLDLQMSGVFAYAIFDKFPVTKYHTLIIPHNHSETYFDLSGAELEDMINISHLMKMRLSELDDTITGWNIGFNVGESAGQTINHCHMHLIPRRDGDVEDPTGGVRWVRGEEIGNYKK